MVEMTIIQHQQVFCCSEPTQIHSIPDFNLGNTHFNWLQEHLCKCLYILPWTYLALHNDLDWGSFLIMWELPHLWKIYRGIQTFHANFEAIHQLLHGMLERAPRVIPSECLVHGGDHSPHRTAFLARIMVRIYPNHHQILELQWIFKRSNEA